MPSSNATSISASSPWPPFLKTPRPVEWLHSIQPGEWAETHYKNSYGPMLDLNRGKKWVLDPHAVEVQDQAAKANVFEVPSGHVIPVVFGGYKTEVTVVLRHFKGLSQNPVFEALHPGRNEWVPVKADDDGKQLRLPVPLVRGCAMVRVLSE